MFPLYKLTKQNYTLCCTFYCTLTGKERKVSGLRRESDILKRTLEYLAIHNEMKLFGTLVHFGQQNEDTANKQTVC